MIKTIVRRGHSLQVGEDSPLNASEIGAFMGWSRATVYRHIEQGYRFEYGRTTTPRHYRHWLRTFSSSQAEKKWRQTQEEKQRLAHELSELH